MELFVDAAGVAAPGLHGWEQAAPVLCGARAWTELAEPPYAPQLLPPNERRRAPPGVRQAFRAAEDAWSRSRLDLAQVAAVFATSDADLAVMDRIAGALCRPVRNVSPTDFHNSVHNAASGYWSIATGCRRPATTVCGYDGTLAMGLLEAAGLALADGMDVLLVAFDVPPPVALQAARPREIAASLALLLSAQHAPGRPRLRLGMTAQPESRLAAPALERLRTANPALRGLPLLAALAGGGGQSIVLPYLDGRGLQVDVHPA
ncbi:MAG: beta-ketoacyl synthase chain length factor [Nevskia sp.]|nr:beta-ketoacyl synthase chain length factor [Nevskia sp.]